MRMWMVDPTIMCVKHLAAEHLEVHMFFNAVQQHRKLDGYAFGGSDGVPKLEIANLRARHHALSREMLERGYNHKSPMSQNLLNPGDQFYHNIWHVKLDPQVSLKILRDRCKGCELRQDAIAALRQHGLVQEAFTR